MFGLAYAVSAETFTVNSTNDPGDGICDATECTFREAINGANANANVGGVPDTVVFNIGTGVQTISVGGALPPIAEAVIIDATTVLGQTIVLAGPGILNGVTVVGPTVYRVGIRANSISDNGLLGIDLGNDGVTRNDNRDADAGPNRLQNYPVLSSASTTTIEGKLNSTPLNTFTIDFYVGRASDPSHFGEGETYLGSTLVTTDSHGNGSFAFSPAVSVPVGQFVTATATDTFGSTSEFSKSKVVR